MDAIQRLVPLEGLVAAEGPFLSVRLATEPAVANAGPRSHLRWRRLREDLLRDGVPDELVGLVDAPVEDAHRWGDVLHVVVTSAGELFVEHADADEADVALARYEWLPWLLPVLAVRQATLPHLVVLTDRRGADITAVRRGGAELLETFTASEEPAQRTAQDGFGAWAEHKLQHWAENTWEHNAGEVATEVERLARLVGARLILVAGDVRAVQFLRDDLPGDLASLVRVAGGERTNADGSGGLTGGAAPFVREAVEAETRALLARFAEEIGQGDRAVQGAEEVLGALSAGQVETLLIADLPGDERQAWFGASPSQVAATEASAELLGFRGRPGRLREVAARAAVGTGATVRVLPSGAGSADDLGALLRWR
ncbi:MAG: hypothetical protein ACKO8G_07590 [Actinomycetota bacterium]